MNKLLCIVLALITLMSVNLFASADSDIRTALAGVEITPPDFDFSEKDKTVMDRATATATSDIVILADTNVRIDTENGVRISYKYPGENVICLTQDLMQQSYLYLYMYQNVTETVNTFIEEGMHLNIYDFETGADIYLYVGDSLISNIVQDISSLSEDDVIFVQQLVADNYFSDASSVTVGVVGGNLWLFADYGVAGMMVTFVNGAEVYCMFRYIDSNSGPVTELTLLDSLSITAA